MLSLNNGAQSEIPIIAGITSARLGHSEASSSSRQHHSLCAQDDQTSFPLLCSRGCTEKLFTRFTPFTSFDGATSERLAAMTSASNNNHFLEQTHDAITAEEITGAEPLNKQNIAIDAASQKRPNACTLHRPSLNPTLDLNSRQSQNSCLLRRRNRSRPPCPP
jgi:hypothetical protein